jgi:sugar lactone lactonase YvrE
MGGALNVSGDGNNLVLVSWVDNDVRIWDPVNKQRIWQKAGLAAPVAAVRFGSDIVVAEHGRQSVVGYDANGDESSIYASGVEAPTGLLVDGDNLFVSDRATGQIMQLAEAGKVLQEPRVVITGLTTPEGFVKHQSAFAVVEADLGQVTVAGADGSKRVVANIPAGSQAASPMQPPSQVFNGITRDDSGTLFVAGESNRVLYKITNAF